MAGEIRYELQGSREHAHDVYEAVLSGTPSSSTVTRWLTPCHSRISTVPRSRFRLARGDGWASIVGILGRALGDVVEGLRPPSALLLQSMSDRLKQESATETERRFAAIECVPMLPESVEIESAELGEFVRARCA